jgi:hypothetical protein
MVDRNKLPDQYIAESEIKKSIAEYQALQGKIKSAHVLGWTKPNQQLESAHLLVDGELTGNEWPPDRLKQQISLRGFLATRLGVRRRNKPS